MMFSYTRFYGSTIKCPKCGNLMKLDDIDYRFHGCQDEYLICDNCNGFSALVKVRFDKIWYTEYIKRDT